VSSVGASSSRSEDPKKAKRKEAFEIKVSYEEYVKASVYMCCRINAFTQLGLPAIDSVIVKWYVHEILACTSDSPDYSSICSRHNAIIDKMIYDCLVKVVETERAGDSMRLRVLETDDEFVPEAWLVQMIHGANPLDIAER